MSPALVKRRECMGQVYKGPQALHKVFAAHKQPQSHAHLFASTSKCWLPATAAYWQGSSPRLSRTLLQSLRASPYLSSSSSAA